jgi:hypothetical protein
MRNHATYISVALWEEPVASVNKWSVTDQEFSLSAKIVE